MTLAKLAQRSKSYMAAELIEAALKLPKYRALLDEAAETVGTVPTKADPRDEQGIQRRQPQLHKAKGEEPTYSAMVDEMVAAKAEKEKEEVKPSRFKQALDLSDEQDKILKTTGLDKVKPENRDKLIALMQLLQTEDSAK